MTGPPTSVGECFLCSRLGTCAETSVGKVSAGYTCPLYDPANEALVYARFIMVDRHNFVPAVRAMLGVVEEEKYDPMNDPTTTRYEPPPPGTTVSQRLAMFEQWGFPNVRMLGVHHYKCLTWDETLAQQMRDACKQKVIEYELANNIIVPDQQPNIPQGEVQMAQPFQPGMMPPPPPQPVPAAPAAPQVAPPVAAVPPSMMPPPPPGIPAPPAFGAPPPGAMPPPMMPPPVAAPPPASPAAAAQAAAPMPDTGKKGKGKAAGASVAPPPPPPPPMAAAPAPSYGVPGAAPMMPAQQAWTPGGFAPPQTPVQAPAPMAAPAGDLGPVLAQVDAVGKAVNATAEGLGKELAELRRQQSLILVALYHIYASDQSLAAAGQANRWDLSTFEKFLAHLGNNLPR